MQISCFFYVAVSSSEEFQSCTEGSTDDERGLAGQPTKAKKQHIDVVHPPTKTPIVILSKLKFVC